MIVVVLFKLILLFCLIFDVLYLGDVVGFWIVLIKIVVVFVEVV